MPAVEGREAWAAEALQQPGAVGHGPGHPEPEEANVGRRPERDDEADVLGAAGRTRDRQLAAPAVAENHGGATGGGHGRLDGGHHLPRPLLGAADVQPRAGHLGPPPAPLQGVGQRPQAPLG